MITDKDHFESLLKTAKDYEAVIIERGRELTQAYRKIEELKDRLSMFTEPKKPAIPRVTKYDGKLTRIWKRVLQGIAK